MCDYSLEGFASRDAEVGDVLVTTLLGGHAIGLVSPMQPDVAVCLLPGSRLRVGGSVPEHLASQYGISAGDMATFKQRDLPREVQDYRDGLVFDHYRGDSGNVLLFQDILSGLSFEVVLIPRKPVSEPGSNERVRELEPA